MALKVVGSGLGRTGTKSMQTALNILGFGPCHHMIEVFKHPESMALWIEGRSRTAGLGCDLQGLSFDGGLSGRRILRAKLPLTIPTQRFCTRCATPTNGLNPPKTTIFAPSGPAFRDGPMSAFFNSFVVPFREHIHDRAFMTDYFRRHTEEVKATIPANRLLIYEVGEGWERLCQFLGVPVPNEPYPSENSRAEFIGRVPGLSNAAGPVRT